VLNTVLHLSDDHLGNVLNMLSGMLVKTTTLLVLGDPVYDVNCECAVQL